MIRILLHDNYYVIASRHIYFIYFAVAILFGIFCTVYYAYPRFFGRPLNKLLSYIHFWVTFVGAYILFWTRDFGYEGMAGMPRRYLDTAIGRCRSGFIISDADLMRDWLRSACWLRNYCSSLI